MWHGCATKSCLLSFLSSFTVLKSTSQRSCIISPSVSQTAGTHYHWDIHYVIVLLAILFSNSNLPWEIWLKKKSIHVMKGKGCDIDWFTDWGLQACASRPGVKCGVGSGELDSTDRDQKKGCKALNWSSYSRTLWDPPKQIIFWRTVPL